MQLIALEIRGLLQYFRDVSAIVFVFLIISSTSAGLRFAVQRLTCLFLLSYLMSFSSNRGILT